MAAAYACQDQKTCDTALAMTLICSQFLRNECSRHITITTKFRGKSSMIIIDEQPPRAHKQAQNRQPATHFACRDLLARGLTASLGSLPNVRENEADVSVVTLLHVMRSLSLGRRSAQRLVLLFVFVSSFPELVRSDTFQVRLPEGSSNRADFRATPQLVLVWKLGLYDLRMGSLLRVKRVSVCNKGACFCQLWLPHTGQLLHVSSVCLHFHLLCASPCPTAFGAKALESMPVLLFASLHCNVFRQSMGV